jgi:folate-binding protein YgfZ
MNTPWTEYLAREGATFDGASIRFDAADPRAHAAAGATTVIPLTHLGLIRSSGEESAPFLHNLFSNDVNKLAPEAVQWNSFNSPKGRMLASLLLWREVAGHMLAVSADIHPALLKKLSMYVLRSKVKLTDGDADTVLVGVSGKDASAVLGRAGLPLPAGPMRQAAAGEARCLQLDANSFVLALPAAEAPARFAALVAAGALKAGTDAWQLAMIRAGVPLVTAATQEEFVAQMLNYEVIGGVSFNKGCYPGQEIVARTQYLGKLKKRMYRVHVAAEAAPEPGADLYTPDFGEQSAGKLVNVVPAPEGGFEALAVMQISCAETGDVRVGRPDGPPLAFLDLPYAVS